MRISFPVYPGSQPSVENHRGARLRGSLNDWRSRRGGCTGRSKGFLPTSFPPPGYWLVPSGVYPESGAARQGDSAFAEQNPAHWQSGTLSPFPVRTEFFLMIPPSTYALSCRTRYRSSSLQVHPCMAAGTLQSPVQVIHDQSGRAWPFQRIAGLPVPSGYLCHNVLGTRARSIRQDMIPMIRERCGGYRSIPIRFIPGKRGRW